MIILKIKKPGYTVDIPGLTTCRTPVEIDISKMDIRIVAMSLKTAGISEYEIIADTGKGVREVYSKNDFEAVEKKTKTSEIKSLNKRLNNLEKLLKTFLVQQQGNSDLEKEQITNKLNNLERLLRSKSPSFNKKLIENEPDIEDLEEFFIPEVDTSQMKIESKNLKIIKKESDNLDDNADLLSNLMKK
ncbi:MAG: hypothetical protein ACFFG0_01305 [Candidatus Thorarchaeota archaeon]